MHQYQIAACVFMRFDPQTGALTLNGEKHYYYLNPPEVPVGDYALVHNGKDFGVVKVLKHLSYAEDVYATKVTKPLISHIHPNQPLYQRAMDEIALRGEELLTKRIEANIERERTPPSEEGW